MKLAGSNVSTKYFQLQLEYREQRRIRVTVCNVPVQLNRNVLTAYLNAYSSVEEVMPVRVADGTAHRDYILNVCLNREGFQAIPHIITYKDQQMRVVVVSRQPLCWSCKQLGHLARFCSQMTPTNNINNNNNNKGKTTSPTTKPALEPGTIKTIQEKDGSKSPGKRNIQLKQ